MTGATTPALSARCLRALQQEGGVLIPTRRGGHSRLTNPLYPGELKALRLPAPGRAFPLHRSGALALLLKAADVLERHEVDLSGRYSDEAIAAELARVASALFTNGCEMATAVRQFTADKAWVPDWTSVQPEERAARSDLADLTAWATLEAVALWSTEPGV